MIEGAGHHVGAAADQGLERARPTGEVGDLHVEAGVAEIAEPLRHCQRQIEQRGLAADRKAHAR